MRSTYVIMLLNSVHFKILTIVYISNILPIINTFLVDQL